MSQGTSTVTLEPSHLSPEVSASGDEKSAGDFTCDFHQRYLTEEEQQTRGAAWRICVFDQCRSERLGEITLKKCEGPCTRMWFGARQSAQACKGHAAMITNYEVMQGIARSLQEKATQSTTEAVAHVNTCRAAGKFRYARTLGSKRD